MERLRVLTAELAAAEDMAAVTEIVVAQAARAMGASVATLSLLTAPDTMTLVAIRGGRPETEDRWRTYPLAADMPACDAVRTGEVIALAGRDAIERRYPQLAGEVRSERSLLCLPLIAGDRRMGAIGLMFEGNELPPDHDSVFVPLFADTCAQAMVRVEAMTAAAESSAKLAFLADAAVELASSLDYRATLANVAALVVRALGDWCAIEILEDGVLHTLAVAHVDPAKVQWARELQARYPADPNSPTGAPNVVRTGVSELYPEITDEMLVAGAQDAEHLQLARDLNLTSALVVPLTARDRVFGAITIMSAESGRHYGPGDLAVAEDLATRAAMAIDNAELFSQTHQVALRLQQAVLPASVPDLPGWQLAVHYSASGRTEVGGDFYDVLPQPDGRVAVVVGDVMGRGVEAAAAMAQMRAAIRAYAAGDPDPVAVMTRLDTMFDRYAQNQLVTVAYALIDGEARSVSVANAGHMPPLVVDRAGSVEEACAVAQPPLGVSCAERVAKVCALPEGATLLLYTDGLVERRDEDIDVSVRRLVEVVGALSADDLPAALTDVIAGIQDVDRDDDVTVLAIRPKHAG